MIKFDRPSIFTAMLTAGISLITSSNYAQTFQEGLNQIRTENNLIGLAVGVRCGSTPLASYYAGSANNNSEISINENTMFRVASISKSFTAAGLMLLYDQGLFELEDDISEALNYVVRNPDFPDIPITYRMLLSHQSSLQDGSGYSPFLSATYQSDPIPDMQEVLLEEGAYFTPNMWRTEEPGTYFAYSNINYGLIGTLIEALSGQRFDEFMRINLLEPLNIQGGYNPSALSDIENLAVLYRDNIPQADNFNGQNPQSNVPDDYVPGTNGSLFAPQGGLRCTLEDLLDFATMLYNQGNFEGTQILSSETVEEMLSTHWNFDGNNGDNYFGLFNRWGLGFHHSGAEGVNDKVVTNEILSGHPGEAYGLISDLYFDPESGYTIAFLTNGYSSGGGYAFGEESIYYLPEEQTFSLAENLFWEECSVLSSNTLDIENDCSGLKHEPVSNTLIIPEHLHGSHLRVYGLDGKLLDSRIIRSNTVLSGDGHQFKVVHLNNDKQNCILKTITP
jgi:CubicO group peptidase (beta-lactamase class C family)